MAQIDDVSRSFRLDPECQPQKYFRHAVYNHWDPYDDIPQELLIDDREKLIDDGLSDEEFTEFMTALAMFGAGEEAVTEDLAPLLLVLDDINDQMYVSSQIYDEAKHAQFFDRYWREVVFPVAEELGFERVYPTNQTFFPDGYVSLFTQNEEAMEHLLVEDTPETRTEAFSHYHLTVESILAQTAYYGFESAFSPRADDISARKFPNLDGLIEGIGYVRADEGRHVGFGMYKVHQLLKDGVGDEIVNETISGLMPDVFATFGGFELLFKAEPLGAYASERYAQRIETITDSETDLPSVEEFVALERAETAEH